MKKGDLVTVLDPGMTYDSYEQKFKEMGFKKKEYNQWFRKGTIAKIFAVGRHSDGHKIYAIRDFLGNESLIREKGIQCIVDVVNSEDIIHEETKCPTIQELIYEKQGFKVGDVVTVTHKVPSKDLGWNNPWIEDMDEFVGDVGVIEGILVDYGVRIDFGKTLKYYFPPQALKKVDIKFVKIDKNYTAKVFPGEKIKVGCVTITPEIFNEIKNAFEER